jgi:predicted RNA-binding Zn-ribbon protein involved in translation (DUF1610 family)
MGQLVNLKCKKCGYETNLGLGAGMTFNNLEMVISYFDKETQGKIRALAESSNKLWYVYREIGICEKCGKISAIAVFKTTDASGKEIMYHSRCQCGSANVELHDFEKVQEGKDILYCPACGDALEVSVTGHWD